MTRNTALLVQSALITAMPARALMRTAVITVLVSFFALSSAQAKGVDGLKVFFCDTGGPLASSGRAQPCTAAQAGDALYLIDNGVGGWNILRGMRAPVNGLKAILITHLHSDHIAGVGEAAEMSWINGRVDPLTVIGPEGVAAKGADVLIHEAQSNAMMMAASRTVSRVNPRGAALLADTVTYHTEPIEAADLARSAGMPGFPETFTKGIEDGGKLDWRLAEDGMILELPAGRTEIKISE